jgi:hypothetical protein
MANDLTNLTPQILGQILSVLREYCTMPRLVNNMYSSDAASMGSEIEINDLADMTAYDVTPGASPNTNIMSDVVASQRKILLNKFKAVTFKLTDKEIKEIQEGTRPRAIEKAVKALANQINGDIMALYKEVYNYVGVAGTTPFGTSTKEAQDAARVLTSNVADKADRRLVMDEFAYANALGLNVLQKVNESGSPEALREATITRAVGFDWYEDQQTPTHTSTATGTYAVDVNAAAGAVSIAVDNGAGADVTVPAVGDIFQIAGHLSPKDGKAQNYVVTSVTADTPSTNETTLGVSPALVASAADGAAVTFVTTAAQTQVTNLAFHMEAFAFASRPMLDLETPGSMIQAISDSISGLSMRYEIQREWKQTIFSLDCLYGVKAVRPELAVRILG